MTKPIIWTDSAANDLQRIVEYIAIDSEQYANVFYDAAREVADSLSTFSNKDELCLRLTTQTFEKCLFIAID